MLTELLMNVLLRLRDGMQFLRQIHSLFTSTSTILSGWNAERTEEHSEYFILHLQPLTK